MQTLANKQPSIIRIHSGQFLVLASRMKQGRALPAAVDIIAANAVYTPNDRTFFLAHSRGERQNKMPPHRLARKLQAGTTNARPRSLRGHSGPTRASLA